MSTGRHSFKHNDAARLIRAIEAAGKTIKSVTLNEGKVTVTVGQQQASESIKGDDDVESWMKKHHADQR